MTLKCVGNRPSLVYTMDCRPLDAEVLSEAMVVKIAVELEERRILQFSYWFVESTMSSGKWWLFCVIINVLT